MKKTVLSIQKAAIAVKLREAVSAYQKRTGERMTYALLAEITGLSVATLQSIAARPTYNTRLSTIARLCAALECPPSEILELQTPKRSK